MLSMRENWLFISWECAKIGYWLAEHTRKLFTCYLNIRKNHCGAARAFSEFFLSSPCHPLLSLLIPSLSNVLWPLSHDFVLCLSSYVPFTSLFLVSRPLSPLSRLCSLSPVLCPLSHVSVPCLPSSVPSLTSLKFVSCPTVCPLSYVSVPCLPSSIPSLSYMFLASHPAVPSLTSLFLLSRPLSPVSRAP